MLFKSKDEVPITDIEFSKFIRNASAAKKGVYTMVMKKAIESQRNTMEAARRREDEKIQAIINANSLVSF